MIPNDKTKCGQIAIDLKILTPSAVDEIQTLSQRFAKVRKPVPDVLNRARIPKLNEALADLITKSCLALQVLLVLGTLSYTKDFSLAADAAGVSAILLGVAPTIVFYSVGAVWTFSRIPFKFAPFLAVVFLFAFLHAFNNLASSSPTSSPPWTQVYLPWVVGGFALLYALSVARTSWRRYLLDYYETRSTLLRRLFSRIELFIETATAGKSRTTDFEAERKEVLTRIAQVLHLSPYQSLQRDLLWFNPSVAATTVWLHELTTVSAEPARKEFRILEFAVADEEVAGDDVLRALGQIKSAYRAAFHDEDWYQDHMAQCQANIEAFRKHPDRAKRTSLAGLTLYKQTSLTPDDEELQCVFDDSFKSYVTADLIDNARVRRWIDVQEAAAFVVSDPLGGGESRLEVLVIWKNGIKAFIPSDFSALATASRMLGLWEGIWRMRKDEQEPEPEQASQAS